MTDPTALAPVLAPEERATPAFADPDLSHEQRYNAFVEHVQGGLKVEARDWMPDEYRLSVLRFVEMHANSELMGILPEREWIMRAPTLQAEAGPDGQGPGRGRPRAAALPGGRGPGQDARGRCTSRPARVARPSSTTSSTTRRKTWADVGIIAWLVDAAAIVAQQALRESSYGPYSRTMKKICWEESVHIMHGRDVVVTDDERHLRCSATWSRRRSIGGGGR